MMKVTYAKSYMCAVNIMEFVRGKYNVDIGNEELLYLVIHIQRAMFNNQEANMSKYDNLASFIITNIGGNENIINITLNKIQKIQSFT